MESDFRASFLPKGFSNVSCSGLNMNLSLNEAVAERYTDFLIAGILDRLPGLCTISMPTSESYSRKALFYTGSWVAWGLESRDVPVRKASDHWEIRTVDATSNVYLTMAAYITAEIAGIASQSQLKVRDCRDLLSTKQSRVDAGVEVPIPSTIDIACDHFDELLKDKVFTDILGGDILSFYKVVHKGSLDSVGDMTEQDRKRIYLELF